MSCEKHKYVRLREYDSFIFFPEIIEHSRFRNFGVVSAGFCYINENKVTCFGQSISLNLKGLEDDTKLATKQMFGLDAMLELK